MRLERAARRNVEIRTWKNSSRFEAKIARNFTRSRSGLRSSDASWRARALNSIHESSRLSWGTLRDRRRGRGDGSGASWACRAVMRCVDRSIREFGCARPHDVQLAAPTEAGVYQPIVSKPL